LDVFEEKVFGVLLLFPEKRFLPLILLWQKGFCFCFCLKSETSFFLKRLKYGVHFSLKAFEDLGKGVPPFLFDVIQINVSVLIDLGKGKKFRF